METSDIIEFLTSDLNAGCVLEVLKHADAIQEKIIQRFWSELQHHLIDGAPAQWKDKLIWSPTRWKPASSRNDKKSGWAWLRAQVSHNEDSRESLCYGVGYSISPQGLGLYYGVHWKTEAKPSSNLLCADSVQSLRELLERHGCHTDGPEWWLAWKDWGNFSSINEFLLEFVNARDREFLFQTMREAFWPLIDLTAPQVEQVNGISN
jgi:hypothetical protein